MTIPSQYQLESDHYLIAYYYYDEYYGYGYSNPWGYGFSSTGNPSGYSFPFGFASTFSTEQYIYLGTTVVYYPVVPNLAITAFSAVMESGNREIQVTFENLPFPDFATLSILPAGGSGGGGATFITPGATTRLVGNGSGAQTILNSSSKCNS